MILLLGSLKFNSAEIVFTCSVHPPKIPTIKAIIACQTGSGAPSPPIGEEGKGGGGGLGEGTKRTGPTTGPPTGGSLTGPLRGPLGVGGGRLHVTF